MLTKHVYVSWPFLREAIVLGVSDSKCRVSQGQGRVEHTAEDAAAWQKEMKYQMNKYKTKKGIDMGTYFLPLLRSFFLMGLSGLVQVMLHVQVLKGMKIGRDGSRTKVFSPAHEIVPYQAVLNHHHAPDPKSDEVWPSYWIYANVTKRPFFSSATSTEG